MTIEEYVASVSLENVELEFNEGDEVFWDDPDDGIGSGVYTIQEIYPDSDILLISNGYTETEVFAHELS